jgi:hypothetical protein
MQDHPLQGLMPTRIFDGRGRFVEQSPSAVARDPEAEEAAIQARMMRNAEFHRWYMFNGFLRPALYKLSEEYRFTEPEVWKLIERSAFIPPYREELFVRGFAAGFRGDLVLALHFLIPQVENALRWVLHQLGTIPGSIDDEGIEEDWPLHRCLTAPKLVEFLGADLVYELRTLLIEKGGPNLRHLSMHGVLSPAAFQSLPAFYAWWLFLKITFLLTPVIRQRLAAEQAKRAGAEPAPSADGPGGGDQEQQGDEARAAFQPAE